MSITDGVETPTITEIPTLDVVAGWLKEIADIDEFDPQADMNEQGIDSLDLIELAAFIEDTYEVALDDSAVEEALGDSTLSQVYDRVVAVLTARLGSRATPVDGATPRVG